jgi:hypothetical protein
VIFSIALVRLAYLFLLTRNPSLSVLIQGRKEKLFLMFFDFFQVKHFPHASRGDYFVEVSQYHNAQDCGVPFSPTATKCAFRRRMVGRCDNASEDIFYGELECIDFRIPLFFSSGDFFTLTLVSVGL